jgi:hypothetical protein
MQEMLQNPAYQAIVGGPPLLRMASETAPTSFRESAWPCCAFLGPLMLPPLKTAGSWGGLSG